MILTLKDVRKEAITHTRVTYSRLNNSQNPSSKPEETAKHTVERTHAGKFSVIRLQTKTILSAQIACCWEMISKWQTKNTGILSQWVLLVTIKIRIIKDWQTNVAWVD